MARVSCGYLGGSRCRSHGIFRGRREGGGDCRRDQSEGGVRSEGGAEQSGKNWGRMSAGAEAVAACGPVRKNGWKKTENSKIFRKYEPFGGYSSKFKGVRILLTPSGPREKITVQAWLCNGATGVAVQVRLGLATPSHLCSEKRRCGGRSSPTAYPNRRYLGWVLGAGGLSLKDNRVAKLYVGHVSERSIFFG
jgi:hypothetical protein